MIKKLFSWFFRSRAKENSIEISQESKESCISINHRRYKRKGIHRGEKSDIALSYAISEKPEERYLLVELINKYEYALYFQSPQEKSINVPEREAIILEIAKDVKPGMNIVLHEIEDLSLFLDLGFKEVCIDEFPVIMREYDY